MDENVKLIEAIGNLTFNMEKFQREMAENLVQPMLQYSERMGSFLVAFSEAIEKINFEKYYGLSKGLESFSRFIGQYDFSFPALEKLKFDDYEKIIKQIELNSPSPITVDDKSVHESLQDISIDEKIEIEEDISDIFSRNENWQQTLYSKYKKWATRNPAIAWLLKMILGIILSYMITTALENQGQIITQRALVREEPNVSSTIINNINQNQIVIIVDQAPYYFKVRTSDSLSDSTVIEGWVPKKTVRHIKVVPEDNR